MHLGKAIVYELELARPVLVFVNLINEEEPSSGLIPLACCFEKRARVEIGMIGGYIKCFFTMLAIFVMLEEHGGFSHAAKTSNSNKPLVGKELAEHVSCPGVTYLPLKGCFELYEVLHNGSY